MANEVDERIVAAKFDSSDFEKGVDKTVKKLDELKKSLNLKETGESVAELSKKTTESAKSMDQNIEKLTDRITNFTGMLKQKLLGGIADEIVGVFFKMENAVKSFIRTISTDQISAGMGKYEQILTSVRLMTNAGYSQDTAYKAIEELQDYSDQTSYSLNQMTDALSKMVAAGVDIDTATRSVQGIANACANAGINATDAARAFFNLSQAYGSGKLQYTDYRSLELLNMADKTFKQQMLDAAVMAGTLKKVKDGVYKTVKKEGTKVTGGKTVTEKNLSDALKYGFMTTEAMNALFGEKYYMGELNPGEYINELMKSHSHEKAMEKIKEEYKDIGEEFEKLEKEVGKDKAYEQIKKKHGKKAELIVEELEILEKTVDHNTALTFLKKKYGEVAVSAYNAAREARNFTDVLNTIKDVVATGWAQTWEKLFGKLDEATKFFTVLSDPENSDKGYFGIASAIYEISKWRNDALDAWDTQFGGEGGESFRQAIYYIDEALGNLLQTFQQLLPSSEEFGETLYGLTNDLLKGANNLRTWVFQLREWLNGTSATDETMTRIEKIRQIIKNLTSVFGIAAKVISIGFSALSRALDTLSPVFDAVINAVVGLTNPLSELKNNQKPFDDLANAISNFFKVIEPLIEKATPIIEMLGNVAGTVFGFFTSMAIDTVTMNIELVSEALGLLLEIFGVDSAQIEKGGGVLKGIAEGIDDLKNACTGALTAVKDFFGALIADIRELFGLPLEEGNALEGSAKQGNFFARIKNFFDTNEFIKNAEAWFAKAKADIAAWFSALPEKINSFFHGLFYREVKETSESGKTFDSEGQGIIEEATPLKVWLDGIINSIKTFINDLPNQIKIWGTKIKNAIKNFFNNLFYKITDVESTSGKGNKKVTVTETPLKKWLNGIVESIKNFIKDLPNKIIEGIKAAGAFGRTLIDIIKDFFIKPDEAEQKAKEAVDGISLSGVIDSIKKIGETILNEILSWFTGTDDLESNIQLFSDQVSGFIQSIPGRIWNGFLQAINKLGGYWNKLYASITGQDETNKSGDPASNVTSYIQATLGEGSTIFDAIKGIPGFLEAAFIDAGNILSDLWNKLLAILAGEDASQTSKLKSTQGKDLQSDILDQQVSELSNWDIVAQKISRAIIDVFSKIPIWITDGLIIAINGINGAITWFDNIIESMNLGEQTTDKIADSVDENKDGKTLADKMIELGNSISNLIFHTIPHFISTGFNDVKDKWESTWKPALLGIFDKAINNEELKAKVDAIGDNIIVWIGSLPDKIREAFKSLTDTINSWFKPEESVGVAVLEKTAESIDDGEKDSTIWDNIVAAANNVKDAFIRAFEDIKPDIINFLSNIPTWIAEGINSAIVGIDSAFQTLSNFFKEHNVSEEISKQMQKPIRDKNETDAMFDEVGQGMESSKSSLVEAIKHIGTSISHLITETLPGFIKAGFDALQEKWPEWKESIEGLFNKIDWNSIKINIVKFANGIKDRIINAWPYIKTWIVSGFDAIKDKWAEWKDAIANFFEKIDWGQITIDITAIAEKIKEAILSLPDMIRNAWEQAKELVAKMLNKSDDEIVIDNKNANKKNKYKGSRFDDILGSEEDIKQSFDKAGEATKKASEDSSFWDIINEIGNSIGEVIKTAFDVIGPSIINGWNNSIKLITGLFESIVKWFNGESDGLGEAVDESLGTEFSDDVKKSITGIGESIYKFFIETLPAFLGSAIARISHDLPKMWESFWSSFNTTLVETAEEENEKAKSNSDLIDVATDAAEESLKSVDGIINMVHANIMTGTLTTGVAIIGGLILLVKVIEGIKSLISVFDIAGNLADRMSYKNSIEAVFRSMLNALIVGMALVAYTSTLDDDKFEKATSVLDKITGMLTTIATIYKEAKLGSSFINVTGGLLGGLFKKGNGIDATGLAKDAAKSTGILGSLSDGFSNFISTISTTTGIAVGVDVVGGSISDVIKMLVTRFEDIGTGVRLFGEKISEAIGDIISIRDNVEIAIEVIRRVGLDEDGLISVIQGVAEKKGVASDANHTITEITSPLILLANAFSGDIHAEEMIKALHDLTGMTDEMEKFVNFTKEGDTFDLFKYAISSLGSALSYYGTTTMIPNFSKVTSTGLDNAVAILKHILGDDELMGIAQQLSSAEFGSDTNDMYKAAEQLSIFAGALMQLGKAASAFGTDSGDNMKKFLNAIDDTIPNDNQTHGTEKATTFAQRMATLGSGLSSFTSSIVGIDENSVKVAEYALNVLAAIAERAQFFGKSILTSWFVGSSDLEEFGLGIEVIGSNLKQFLNAIEFDADGKQIEWNFETLRTTMFALSQLASAASKVGTNQVNAFIKLSENLPKLGQNMTKFLDFMTFMSNATDGTIYYNKKFSKDRYDFEWIGNILDAFSSIMESIGFLNKNANLVDNTFSALTSNDHGLVKVMQTAMQTFALITYYFKEGILSADLNIEEVDKRLGSREIPENIMIDMELIKSVIDAISVLFNAIGGIFTLQDLYSGQEMLDGVAAMETILKAVELLSDNVPLLQTFFDKMKIFDADSGVAQAKSVFEAIKTLGEGLRLFSHDYSQQDVLDGLQNILGIKPELLGEAIKNLMSGIQSAIDDPTQMPQIKITPVLDFTQAKADLANFFGADTENLNEMNFGTIISSSLANAFSTDALKPNDYTPQLTTMISDMHTMNTNINLLGSHIDEVARAVSNMYVMLDDGTLVGRIGPRVSAYLAYESTLFENQNATSNVSFAGDFSGV